MPDASWKAVERWVARQLGGKRGGPLNKADVLHDTWAPEVKHRKRFPKWLMGAMEQAVEHSDEQTPVVILFEKYKNRDEALVIMQWRDWIELVEDNYD